MMITWPHLAKLDNRGLKTIFIGYEPESKAYRLFNPVDGRLHVSRDVIFDENTFWSWDDNNMEEHSGEPFMVEYLITEPGEEGVHDHVMASPALSGGASPAASTNPPAPPSVPAPFQASPPAPTPPLVPQPVEFMLPRTTDSNLDTDNEGAARYRLIDDLRRNSQRVEIWEVEHAEVHVTSADEPSTFVEAISNPYWKKAMEEEMDSIISNKTWSLEELPTGH
jgi:hypothetical protein